MASFADVDRAVIRLVTDAPFFGHVAVALRKTLGDAPRTLTADGPAVVLRLEAAEWDARSDAQRSGLLKHELLHLVFGHPFMRRDYGDRARFDLAADLVVSQLLAPEELHEGDLRLSDFADLELLPDQSVGYYYARLADESQEKEPAHDGWEQIDGAAGFERTLMETAILSLMEDLFARANSWGPLPAAVLRRLGQIASRHPTLDWRRVMRLFSATASATSLRNTIHRASKRYGTVPGTKIAPHRNLCVVLDTSGSVPAEDLASFMAEVHHIWRAGAAVTVVCADAEVSQVFTYRGKPPSGLRGGGGTSFDPAIVYANERLHPDGLVYLTDGFAPPPRTKPRYPTLWLITRNGAPTTDTNVSALPGRRARMS